LGKLKHYWQVCTHTSVTVQKEIWRNQNWLKLWKQKVSKFCATSKPNGLTWLFQARWYILEEFKTLLVKMVKKVVVVDSVVANYEL